MAIKVAWYDTAKELLHITFEPEWEWADYTIAMNKVCNVADVSSGHVSLLFDFSQAQHLAKGLSLDYLLKSIEMLPQTVDYIAFIGKNSPSMSVISTYFLVAPQTKGKILSFHMLPEAINTLKSLKQSSMGKHNKVEYLTLLPKPGKTM